MTKVLKCGDLMPGCDFEARAETEQEILQSAAAHAKEVHGLDATPELVEHVKGAIKDE
ncbi:DUF1059 domain-containing protein [Tropicimonas marinistellae]|uniref:DUF1059 domain-containing protein n=1 Tax=Tropicimonas marinistellae TaxID=1739787 RepID=UPI0009901959|nr:DUF1059 domain-containing protein [Tropicimonas marinistellae]